MTTLVATAMRDRCNSTRYVIMNMELCFIEGDPDSRYTELSWLRAESR